MGRSQNELSTLWESFLQALHKELDWQTAMTLLHKRGDTKVCACRGPQLQIRTAKS